MRKGEVEIDWVYYYHIPTLSGPISTVKVTVVEKARNSVVVKMPGGEHKRVRYENLSEDPDPDSKVNKIRRKINKGNRQSPTY